MSANGNDPRLAQLETTLRGVVQPIPDAKVAEPETTYDLAKRITDTAKAMRDLADYSNHVASDLERITAAYIANMGRLLGRMK